MFFIYFVLSWLLPGHKASFTWIKDVAIFAGLVVGGFLFVKRILSMNKAKREVQGHETIEYLTVNNGGIGINLYNNLDPSVMPFFQWSDIKTIHIGFTRDLSFIFSDRKLHYPRENFINQLNNKYPGHEPFEYNPGVYFDRFTIIINKDYGANMQTAYIQIPKTWLYDGQFTELVNTLDSFMLGGIRVYERDGEPYEIIEQALYKALS